MSSPGPSGPDNSKLTAVGCVPTLLSGAIIFCVAIPIVQWRDPETGQPLPRSIAIFAPVVIGAAFHGIVSGVLWLLGFPVFKPPPTEEESMPPDETPK
jgi:hypothetical protein